MTAPATIAAPVVECFHRVVATMPWYRTLLAEQGVAPAAIRDVDDFTRLCPTLGKHNTFERFPMQELAATTALTDLAGVLTSSGHGGRFSFGLTTRAQEAAGAAAIDAALDEAFAVRSTPTLAINCLPMGVTFASRAMTVATTSVREDMAVALVETFGPAYAQVLIVADPLFLKRLVDHARERRVDWTRHRMQVVIGEEVFGERFRRYMSAALGLGRTEQPDTCLLSSFGVGELGLHLLYETSATASLRQLACGDEALATELFGPSAAGCGVPMLFTYAPSRLYLEVDTPAADGFGALTVSMLDPDLPIPLLRYQTGDIVRTIDPAHVAAVLRRRGISLPHALSSSPLVALRGRAREALPNGATVARYRDALYADAAVAVRLTGAMRVTFDARRACMHVQLVSGCEDGRDIPESLRAALPPSVRPQTVRVWPYASFPFGMGLDYERKFTGYVAP